MKLFSREGIFLLFFVLPTILFYQPSRGTVLLIMKSSPDIPSYPIRIAGASDSRAVLRRATQIAARMADMAHLTDQAASFPHQEFAWLAEEGLLEVTLPMQPMDFCRKETSALLQLLKLVGKGNLSVGRIYEGHVNALYLVHLFAREHQKEQWYSTLHQAKKIFGVWNTQAQDGVSIMKQPDGRYRMQGTKTFCSGAGWVARPVVPGTLIDEQGRALGWQMCVVPMEQVPSQSIDPSFWKPLGMKASVSYKISFDGVELTEDDLLGAPDDYHQQPYFSGGAIRFAAVQLGGAEAVFEATCHYLQTLQRTADPYQQMRLGEMAVLIETGNLWLHQAGVQADSQPNGDTLINYANMVRTAVEKIGIEVMQLAERCVGARGLLPPQPFSRLHADLTMYLRQPAPDAALASVGHYVGQAKSDSHALWAVH